MIIESITILSIYYFCFSWKAHLPWNDTFVRKIEKSIKFLILNIYVNSEQRERYFERLSRVALSFGAFCQWLACRAEAGDEPVLVCMIWKQPAGPMSESKKYVVMHNAHEIEFLWHATEKSKLALNIEHESIINLFTRDFYYISHVRLWLFSFSFQCISLCTFRLHSCHLLFSCLYILFVYSMFTGPAFIIHNITGRNILCHSL